MLETVCQATDLDGSLPLVVRGFTVAARRWLGSELQALQEVQRCNGLPRISRPYALDDWPARMGEGRGLCAGLGAEVREVIARTCMVGAARNACCIED